MIIPDKTIMEKTIIFDIMIIIGKTMILDIMIHLSKIVILNNIAILNNLNTNLTNNRFLNHDLITLSNYH